MIGVPLLAVVLMASLAGCGSGQPGPVTTSPTVGQPAPTTGTSTPEPPTTPSPTQPTSLVLDFDSLGPARLGMTMDEFAAALGLPLTLTDISGYADPCWNERVGGPESGIGVMTIDGRDGPVVRISVEGPAADPAALPRTAMLLGVGSTADEVRAAYPGRVTESAAYGNGLALTITDPAAPAGTVLLFETDEQGLVSSMRSGEAGPVSYLEGCS